MAILDIVIVNWNTAHLLCECLDSVLQNIRGWDSAEIRTIVVDNASIDNSVELIKQNYQWVDLIENNENAGFARANNQAIEQSDSDFVLLLNSDTKLHSNALRSLIEFAIDKPKVGAVGSLLLNDDGSLQPACHPMLTPTREFWRLLFLDRFVQARATYRMEAWSRTTPRRVEVIKGACLLLRRKAINQIGMLDVRYFMYTEEVDICYRLAQADWQLWYVPKSVVTHYGGGSSKQMPERMYLELYKSKIQFYRKNGGDRFALWAKFLLGVAYLPRAILQPHRPVYRQLLRSLPLL